MDKAGYCDMTVYSNYLIQNDIVSIVKSIPQSTNDTT